MCEYNRDYHLFYDNFRKLSCNNYFLIMYSIVNLESYRDLSVNARYARVYSSRIICAKLETAYTHVVHCLQMLDYLVAADISIINAF